MELVSREQFQNQLAAWGDYIRRYQGLTPAEQAAFLEKQGYPSFSALLAHVIAWWSDGIERIGQFRLAPDTPPMDYDVDSFNAQAVTRYAPLSQAETLRLFEETRLQLLSLLKELSPEELAHPHINFRLVCEILNHYKEHELN